MASLRLVTDRRGRSGAGSIEKRRRRLRRLVSNVESSWRISISSSSTSRSLCSHVSGSFSELDSISSPLRSFTGGLVRETSGEVDDDDDDSGTGPSCLLLADDRENLGVGANCCQEAEVVARCTFRSDDGGFGSW